jgi:aryl-alcohol dehydrogenase-like predicted oxidoreductase
MELRALGTTGVAVSAYALGTMTFGAEADEAASHAMLDRVLEAGGGFVDTADVYAEGASEEIIGRWLEKEEREATWAVIEAVGEIADTLCTLCNSMALAAAGRPGVTSTIRATRTVEQLDDNMGVGLELEPEQAPGSTTSPTPAYPPTLTASSRR